MTLTDSNRSLHLERRFAAALCCYFLLHILLRVGISGSLDYDEAEQALLAQWLLSGYTEQPPLYTWIQYLLFALLGENVLAVSLQKNGLLLLTYLSVFASGLKLCRNSRSAILATASLLLIPQIGWESQRDMTHTTLVVFAASVTFLQSLRLLEKQTMGNYFLLGICLGIGILAKVNFLLFLAVLGCACLSLDAGRRILLNPRILLSLGLALLVSVDYLLWMYHNQDIVFSASHKFKRALDNYYLTGLLSLATNSFLFLTPLWLFYLLLFPSGYRPQHLCSRSENNLLMERYVFFLVVLLIAVVLIFKVTYVKDRWLQPLFVLLPLFFFQRLDLKAVSDRRFKGFLAITGIAALCVYGAFTIRIAGASYIDRFCRMNYPFEAMAASLNQDALSGELIISDNRFLAGNLRLQFPGSIALIPDYRLERAVDTKDMTRGVLVWKADNRPMPPEDLINYAKTVFDAQLLNRPPTIIEHVQKYGRNETVKMGVFPFHLQKQDPGATAHPKPLR